MIIYESENKRREEYHKAIDIAKTIEEEFHTKCYLTGRGLRNLLKGFKCGVLDYTIVVTPSDNIDLDALSRLNIINIVIENIENYINSKATDIEKIYTDSEGNFFFKGKSLVSLRSRKLSVSALDFLRDEGVLLKILPLIEEGYIIPYEIVEKLNRKISKETMLEVLNRIIDTNNENLVHLFFNMGGFSIITEMTKIDLDDYIGRYSIIQCLSWSSNFGWNRLDLTSLNVCGEFSKREIMYHSLILNALHTSLQIDYNLTFMKMGIFNFYTNVLKWDSKKAENVIKMLEGYIKNRDLQNAKNYSQWVQKYMKTEPIDVSLVFAMYMGEQDYLRNFI